MLCEQLGIVLGGFVYIYFLESSIFRTCNLINAVLVCRALSLVVKCVMLMSILKVQYQLKNAMQEYAVLLILDAMMTTMANPPSLIVRILGSRAPLYMNYVIGLICALRTIPMIVFLLFDPIAFFANLTSDNKITIMKACAAMVFVEFVLHFSTFWDKLKRYEEEQILSGFINVRYLWTAESEDEIANMATKLESQIRRLALDTLMPNIRRQNCFPCCEIIQPEITIANTNQSPTITTAVTEITTTSTAIALPTADNSDSVSIAIQSAQEPSSLPDSNSLISDLDGLSSLRIQEAARNLWNKSECLTWMLVILIGLCMSIEIVFNIHLVNSAKNNFVMPWMMSVNLWLYGVGFFLNYALNRHARPVISFGMACFCLFLFSCRNLLLVFIDDLNSFWLLGFSVFVPIVLCNLFSLFFANLRLYVQNNCKSAFRIQKFLLFYGGNCIALLYTILNYFYLSTTRNELYLTQFACVVISILSIYHNNLYMLMNMIYRSTNTDFLMV